MMAAACIIRGLRRMSVSAEGVLAEAQLEKAVPARNDEKRPAPGPEDPIAHVRSHPITQEKPIMTAAIGRARRDAIRSRLLTSATRLERLSEDRDLPGVSRLAYLDLAARCRAQALSLDAHP
jgi:hypothetical protein